jgi:hypothetical protein
VRCINSNDSFFDQVFLEIEFRVTRGARAEVRCATDKISVGNGQIFMSKGSLERGEKRLPEYVANSYLDHHGRGRILFGAVICVLDSAALYFSSEC